MNTEGDWEGGGDQIETTEQPVSTEPRQIATTEKRASLVANDLGYIAPTSIEEAVRMARYVIAGGLAPDSYKKRGQQEVDQGMVVLGIMAALEAGLPPLYGLRQIAIINNRPTIWGDAAMALVQSKNVIAEYHEELTGPLPEGELNEWPDEFGWVVTIKRRGQQGEYTGRFTVGDAKRAKLWLNPRKQPWLEHPLRMLKIRARTFPLRDGFADALAGLAIREEIEDMLDMEEAKVVEVKLNEGPKVEAPPMPETAHAEPVD